MIEPESKPRQSFAAWMRGEFEEGVAVAFALRRYAERGPEEFREVAELAGEIVMDHGPDRVLVRQRSRTVL